MRILESGSRPVNGIGNGLEGFVVAVTRSCSPSHRGAAASRLTLYSPVTGMPVHLAHDLGYLFLGRPPLAAAADRWHRPAIRSSSVRQLASQLGSSALAAVLPRLFSRLALGLFNLPPGGAPSARGSPAPGAVPPSLPPTGPQPSPRSRRSASSLLQLSRRSLEAGLPPSPAPPLDLQPHDSPVTLSSSAGIESISVAGGRRPHRPGRSPCLAGAGRRCSAGTEWPRRDRACRRSRPRDVPRSRSRSPRTIDDGILD